MKKLLLTTITLTAIGVAVKVMKDKKAKSKILNTIYFGLDEPTTPEKGDVWYKPNGEMKKY